MDEAAAMTESPVAKKPRLVSHSDESDIKKVPEQKPHLFKCKYILQGHRKPVTSVKFSPNGKLLATCCKFIEFKMAI